MSKTHPNAPLPIGPPPDRGSHDLALLLEEPFAKAWGRAAPAAIATPLRARLMDRLARSREAEAGMATRRRRTAVRRTLAPGIAEQTLYAAPADRVLRPGEPVQVRLLELAPGTGLAPELLGGQAFATRHRELLVLAGSVELEHRLLALRDYHVTPAGASMPMLRSAQGALLFLREALVPARPDDAAFTVLDTEAGWPDFAPGIQRRVLWQRDGQAAMLYYAQPGAQVPHHTHGHDEECLMVQGELFLDDVLLQQGDYQLAPAGSRHHLTHTDTGVVIYAHGDIELQFVA